MRKFEISDLTHLHKRLINCVVLFVTWKYTHMAWFPTFTQENNKSHHSVRDSEICANFQRTIIAQEIGKFCRSVRDSEICAHVQLSTFTQENEKLRRG